ncbi:MAG TPA: translocation/assembly module TamB domain-containing protein [Bauldia sp.]|nr:translocation/assembly module TamB domain-containing protein [Bauldia sp.]
MRRLLLTIVAALVAIVVIAGVLLATPWGRGLVVAQIQSGAASAGLTVSIEGAGGWPPFTLGAQRITIADADGVFAEVDNLDVNIKTTALLVGRIAFDSLSAGRVAVVRQPHIGGGGGGGAALPFAADAVSVARLELGEGLTGRPATLKLAGSLVSAAGGRLSGSVNAERIDGRTGTLTATFSRANATAPIAADIELVEDTDGVLVGLIGRGSGPGYRLQAKSTVSGDSVSGSVSLASNGAARFAGQFSLAPADNGGTHVVASGSGDLTELVPSEYADLLAGPISLAADADWTPGSGALPAIAVRRGSFSTGNVKANISGTFSDAVADLTVRLDAAKAGGGALNVPLTNPPSQIESLTLAGKIAPASDRVRMELTGQAAGLATGGVSIPGLGLSLAVEAPRANPLAADKLPFAFRAEADAIETPSGRIASAGGVPVVLTADGSYDTGARTAATNAKLTIAGGSFSFAGTLAADGAKGEAGAEFADLAPLTPLAGRALGGAISAKASGTFAAEAAFRLVAAATDLNLGEPTSARLLRGQTQIAATVGVKSDGVSIDDLSVTGPALNATGQFALANGTIVGTAKGGVADLSLLAEQSSGAATFEATVSGAATRPAISANITIAKGALLGQPIDNATVKLNTAPTDSGWGAALALSGGFAGRPLSGTADAALDAAGALAFPNVDLAIGDNRITGAITRTAAGPLSGTLAVNAPNVATLAALGLVTASGSGEARVTFAPDGARQSLAVTFSGDGVSYQTIAAAKVSGDVRIDDAFGTPLVTGNANASALNIGGFHIDTASATANVSGGATRFTATAKGRDLDLSGSGSLAPATGGNAVRLDALNGRAFGLPVALNAPVTVNLGSGGSGISGAVLALGGGTLRVDGAVAPALNLTVVADKVAAAIANGFAPALGAEGIISGTARVTGPAATPAIQWQADWSGARVTATRNAGLPPLVLSARGNANGKATNITARLTGAGLALDITGDVPFSGPGLAVRANGTAPLALLALESNRELRLAGTARVNLALSGSLANVATSGTVDLADATVADTDSGFGIAGATGRIAFDGQRATVQGLTGRLAQGGDISVAGSVGIADPGLPAQLTVRVSNGRYADGRMLNTTFSGDLAINGPILGNGVVTGTVNLGRTEIQLPDRLAGSATAIDVKHVNAPRGFKPPKAREAVKRGGPASGSGGLRLDVNLTGNSGIFVRGFGIDSELGGSLHLTGTTGFPQTAGGFEMRRGRIEVLGRRFDFQSGTLTFAGDLVPLLDFEATTTTSDGTVTLHVTGPANDPAIRFTSSPDMPEEEILSRLLFNRSVGTLSPLQAAQLVDAVAQLTGVGPSGGIFARIREATGLDDLDIRQSANGGTTVGVAKRINDNIRVGVEAGTDSAEGRVTIDLDLTKNLKARGEAGQDGTGKVGLTYEREY